MISFRIFFFLVLATAFIGCNYNRVRGAAQNGSPSEGENVRLMASMDYASIHFAVIGPSCLNCHSNATGNQGGVNFETYAQVRANLNRIYFRSIQKKDMPPAGLDFQQHELLKAWIEAGAPEKNTGRVTGPKISGPITWSVIRDRVLQSSCLDCHFGKTPDGGLDFTSAEVVRKNIYAIFEAAIVNQRMPLEPYPAMSDSEKQAIMTWISQGMPE